MKSDILIVTCTAGLLAGCAVGPDYKRPSALKSQPMPDSYAGFESNAPPSSASTTNTPAWKPAAPAADQPRGSWWEVFEDKELNRLERLAAADNQSLAAGLARLEQSRALVKVAQSSFFPQLSANPSATRQRTSVNAPQNGGPAGEAYWYNTFTLPADLSWELDLWGRIRRQTESAKARFVASADDLESLRLSVQAEIASDYAVLRALEAERKLLVDTIEAYRHSLELTQNRRRGGIASDLDVSQAQTQLRGAQAQVPAVDLQYEDFVHALAMLCGQPASRFQVAPAASRPETVPSVPPGLPSELLQRRPDIAAVERRMAAANADIGVATSAFYPDVVINGLAGMQSVNAGTLLDWPSRFWSIGPSLDLPLFTGGRNRAQLTVARQAYDEAVANYRQTVVTAFQEVEDQLSAQRLLAAQLDAEKAALESARHTLEIANNRYKAGLVTYLEVAISQTAALMQEQAVVQLQGQDRVAVVNLIKALGGKWQEAG
jgi:multidrug efflux system outer membrane protein